MPAYTREFMAEAAREMPLLPEHGAIIGMLSDYAVMRGQARACR